ncbi:hypothetical protein MTR67_046225 [Solanum verrucosum]|uniref:C2H2-type domain-containing protein n=1 Tax=Solanum verrucosum TaxID=315347 RepID=A0AAF0UU58_SOLVR|nr:zinc finger protein 8-like [Solanum verrucosum]WMV52840.1 hypothetical protein MTR67_046225 [Solanum verrucosum]
MEKIEREALDFMNVKSFSQLPITQPVNEKPIRLFGKEFGGGGGDSTNITTTATNMTESIDNNPFHDEPETNTVNLANCAVKEIHIDKNVEIMRKYECHYCFRSFPTSQALGGHQNAHKKERLNAKRPHLQSSIVHDQPTIYGIRNRHRLGEATASTRLTHHHSTWTNINNNTPRFNGNDHNVNVISPINGNPFMTFWQIPPTVYHNNSSSADNNNNLVFSNDDLIRTPPMVNVSTNCESNFVYKPKGEVQDHVSLDLHL